MVNNKKRSNSTKCAVFFCFKEKNMKKPFRIWRDRRVSEIMTLCLDDLKSSSFWNDANKRITTKHTYQTYLSVWHEQYTTHIPIHIHHPQCKMENDCHVWSCCLKVQLAIYSNIHEAGVFPQIWVIKCVQTKPKKRKEREKRIKQIELNHFSCSISVNGNEFVILSKVIKLSLYFDTSIMAAMIKTER